MNYTENKRILTLINNIEDNLSNLKQCFDVTDNRMFIDQLQNIDVQIQLFQSFYKTTQKGKNNA